MSKDTPYPPGPGAPPPYPTSSGGFPQPNTAPYPGGPSPQYQPQPQPVVQQMVVQQQFRDSQVQVKCPNCSNTVMTNLSYRVGNMTWVVMGVLLVLGFWMGCFLIPLCIDSLKDVDHTCPVCSYHLGKYERMKF